ncbi:MAG: hypothetical protein LBT34_03130 [Clostridiales Family XIII bacterium]|nr:hypothetical protein [Clostridiales Family XIII bacterium]
MDWSYLAYGILIILTAAGVWLLLPEWKRLNVIEGGRRRISLAEKKADKYRAAFRERLAKEKKEKEVYEAIGFLRNIIAVDMGEKMSADLVLQKLAENEGLMRPVYVRLLSLHRLNKKKEEEEFFESEVRGDVGKDFIRIILQWDEINPAELNAALLSYQKAIKETRTTSQKRRDEVISDLIYLPVVINVLSIFLNFVYVAYFMQQKEMLQGIFM